MEQSGGERLISCRLVPSDLGGEPCDGRAMTMEAFDIEPADWGGDRERAERLGLQHQRAQDVDAEVGDRGGDVADGRSPTEVS